MFKFLNKYKYFLIIPLFIVIAILMVLNFKMTHRMIQDKYNQINHMVEDSVMNAFVDIDRIYMGKEDEINNKMKDYSDQLLAYYDKTPDINQWDLDALKASFADYEIYVIDDQLKVVASSLKADVGLDFNQYPSFASLLQNRFDSDSFFVGDLQVSINTGTFQKYSYIPSPDHRYIFELSIDVDRFLEESKQLNASEESLSLKERYPSVSNITLYKYSEDNKQTVRIIPNHPLQAVNDPQIKESVERALLLGEKQSYKVYEDHQYSRQTYMPIILGEDSVFWNNMVVCVTYDLKPMYLEEQRAKEMLMINLMALMIILATFFISLSFLIKRLESLAFKDSLTGLMNRVAFEEKIKKYYVKHRSMTSPLFMMFIDINKFKFINDTYGHQMGDDVIKAVAGILEINFADKGCVARLGGDEFVIAITQIESIEALAQQVENMINLFSDPLTLNGESVDISLSVGIAQQEDTSLDIEALIQRADMAMYQSKKREMPYVIDGGN